jgi:hypothetical protein
VVNHCCVHASALADRSYRHLIEAALGKLNLCGDEYVIAAVF